MLAVLRAMAFGNYALMALMALQLLDIATGVVSAWGRGAISSEVSRKGISEKVLTLLAVGVAYLVGSLVGVPLGLAAALWYCKPEVVSIAENLGQAGVPLPGFIEGALARLHTAPQPEPKAAPPRGAA